MTEYQAIKILQEEKSWESDDRKIDAFIMGIDALKEIQQYREIGTPEELKQLKENGSFTGMELAQLAIGQMKLKEYMAIGTPEECSAAVKKQKEMIEYCDENDCSDCPFHNTSQKYNKCMNDFIANEIVKGCGVDE